MRIVERGKRKKEEKKLQHGSLLITTAQFVTSEKRRVEQVSLPRIFPSVQLPCDTRFDEMEVSVGRGHDEIDANESVEFLFRRSSTRSMQLDLIPYDDIIHRC